MPQQIHQLFYLHIKNKLAAWHSVIIAHTDFHNTLAIKRKLCIHISPTGKKMFPNSDRRRNTTVLKFHYVEHKNAHKQYR